MSCQNWSLLSICFASGRECFSVWWLQLTPRHSPLRIGNGWAVNLIGHDLSFGYESVCHLCSDVTVWVQSPRLGLSHLQKTSHMAIPAAEWTGGSICYLCLAEQSPNQALCRWDRSTLIILILSVHWSLLEPDQGSTVAPHLPPTLSNTLLHCPFLQVILQNSIVYPFACYSCEPRWLYTHSYLQAFSHFLCVSPITAGNGGSFVDIL